jgi:hypothetical protein
MTRIRCCDAHPGNKNMMSIIIPPLASIIASRATSSRE